MSLNLFEQEPQDLPLNLAALKLFTGEDRERMAAKSDSTGNTIVLLYGNDATGKTSLCRAINDRDSATVVCMTRGEQLPSLLDDGNLFDYASVDQQTLEYPINTYPAFPTTFQGHRILRIVLDADLSTLKDRISRRPSHDSYETEKALHYYSKKFYDLALMYGWPIVDTNGTIEHSLKQIDYLINNPKHVAFLASLALRDITPTHLYEESDIYALIRNDQVSITEDRLNDLVTDLCKDGGYDKGVVEDQVIHDSHLARNLVARRLLADKAAAVPVSDYFTLVCEGESKKVYKLKTTRTAFFDNKVFIVLKPTIYSHSKQSTGEIDGLAQIRAQGTRLFLDMLHRAGITHAYLAVNSHGVIIADEIIPTPLEICWKRYCVGTDKHSFYGMTANRAICHEDGEYVSGPYVRCDWRNPNHLIENGQPIGGAEDRRDYYLLEASMGKSEFFARCLRHLHPLGDKTVPPQLAAMVQNLTRTNDTTFAAFLTFQHYLAKIDLKLVDGCIMLTAAGDKIWSEVNPDCMRIVGSADDCFDKDIWRAGGSSKADFIKQKWTKLNQMLTSELTNHPFHDTEMRQLIEPYGAQAVQLLNQTSLKLSCQTRCCLEDLGKSNRIDMAHILSEQTKTRANSSTSELDKASCLNNFTMPMVNLAEAVTLVTGRNRHQSSQSITGC